MSDAMYIKDRSGFEPLTATIVAGSIGPIVESGRYQVSCTGSTVYLRARSTQVDAETVTPPSGSVRGIELFGGNATDILLDTGSYLGAITASGTAEINLHWVGSN
ncbi:hypothetical protein Nit79A3_2390 [Nitrosomonas sp. Is79A3]|uniref:hypothetical protein n=1 Tax=Nitrosomonas sp. (strain Is79A3) TaxID=261292 RepID=UPI000215CA17